VVDRGFATTPIAFVSFFFAADCPISASKNPCRYILDDQAVAMGPLSCALALVGGGGGGGP
jgi:hypothetical protein